jgi:hypothetical protein
MPCLFRRAGSQATCTTTRCEDHGNWPPRIVASSQTQALFAGAHGRCWPRCTAWLRAAALQNGLPIPSRPALAKMGGHKKKVSADHVALILLGMPESVTSATGRAAARHSPSLCEWPASAAAQAYRPEAGSGSYAFAWRRGAGHGDGAQRRCLRHSCLPDGASGPEGLGGGSGGRQASREGHWP